MRMLLAGVIAFLVYSAYGSSAGMAPEPAPEAEVAIAGADSIVIPNVFTPNGDGLNDLFRIDGLAVMDLNVYNSFGQLVAHLQLPHQSWDGRTEAGVQASEGTYYYVLQGEALTGEKIDRSGSITLIR